MAIDPGPTVEMLAQIPAGGRVLSAAVSMPPDPLGLVVFPRAGDATLSARVDAVLARSLYELRFGTLRCELLADGETAPGDGASDLPLLVRRLLRVTAWLGRVPRYADLPIGYVGWRLGGMAALAAAPLYGPQVRALVAVDARVEIADDALPLVAAPVLLIVTGPDARLLSLNYAALAQLRGEKELAVLPVRGPLLEAPRAIEQLNWFVTGWLKRYLVAPTTEVRRMALTGEAG